MEKEADFTSPKLIILDDGTLAILKNKTIKNKEGYISTKYYYKKIFNNDE